MRIQNSSNKKKTLDKVLIILATITIAMALLIITTIVLNNAKIQSFEQKGNEIKESYSSTENNTWDISENGDGSVIAILSDDGTLTISGKGNMKNWNNNMNRPWNNISEQIKSVKIEEGLTNISDFAFMSFSNITNITIPKSVTAIGKQTFYKCSSLINITIPEGVTHIKSYAFAECTSLENIIIPESVENIGTRLFQNCIRLKSVELPKETSFNGDIFFDSVIQIFITVGSETEQEIDMPEIIKRAKTEEDILYTEKDFTFKNCKMNEDNTKLIINTENLKKGNETGIKINGGVLNDLTVIVMLPEMIWDISKDENSSVYAMFKYENKLLTISGDGDMKDFGWDFGPWYYLRKYIEGVIIEEGITRIGTYCFFDNPGVNNISLPTTLKLIAPYAFRGCENLETIDIPEGTHTIGTATFSSCNNLREVNISSTVYAIGVDNVTIHWDEGMLEGLTITTIGGVFQECISLENINVNSNNKYYASDDGVLFNKSKSSLIIYPAGRMQKTYEIPSTVNEIADEAFDSCVNLQTVDIPKAVEKIGKQCFRGSNVSEIILNEGLKTIGEYAFYANDKIEEIYIPNSVEDIGKGSLCKMDSLKNIEVGTNNKNYSSEEGILFSKDKTQILQYPANKLGSIYIIPNTVKIIETGAFGYGNNLEYLKINDDAGKIGTSAFVFSKLMGIYIPDSVNTIDTFNVAGEITPFFGCKDYTIYCNDNSYAKEFCINYNLNYSTNNTEILEIFQLNTLDNISVTKPPIITAYIEGQNFDKTGMIVTATYNDGKTKEVTDYTVTDGNNLTVGQTSVTISYTENGVTKTTTQNITVTEKQSLEIDLGEYKEEQEGEEIYIKNILPLTSIREVLNNIKTNGTIEIYKGTEKITNTDTNLGTGMTIRIILNNEIMEYTIIVTGDLDGDGKIKISDLARISRIGVKDAEPTKLEKLAIDVNSDGEIKINDLAIISRLAVQ